MVLVIFGFSNQQGEQSMGFSYKVSGVLVDMADSIHLIDMKWNSKEHAIEQMQTPVRKTAHMMEFGALAAAVYLALKYDGFPYRFTKYLTFLLVLAVAASDEYHQLFIPGRNGTPRDVAIDMVGCLVLIVVCVLCDKRKNIVI